MSHAPSCPTSPFDALRNRHSGPALRASLGALALLAAATVPAQTLFAATERAEAGQAISVTGSGFDGSTRLTIQRYGSTGVLGAASSVTVSARTDFGLTAQLPTNLAFGIFRIQASGAAGTGGSILLNAPRVQWIDTKGATAGQTVRVVGRNLRPTASLTTVRLIDAATGATLNASVTATSDYDLAFTMPSGVIAGHTYRVLVNSNIAGLASETAAPETLSAVASTADPLGLGTSWAGDFVPITANVYNLKTDPRLSLHAVGDGSTNDARAVQAASVYISQHGGGTLYLPAGTYNVDDGSTVQLLSKVLLKGDGAGKTILQVGYRFNAATACPDGYFALEFCGGKDIGMVGLTVRNQNANAKPNGVMLGGYGDDGINQSVMQNVAFELNNGQQITLVRVRQSSILNCRFTCNSTSGGPLWLEGARYLRLSNNVFDYRNGRTVLLFSSHSVIDNNTILKNNAYHTPGSIETGGLELSYGQQLLVKGNYVAGYGPAITKPPLDGEMIMTQQSNIPDFNDAGRVASVSGTRLVPSGKSWPTSWLAPGRDDLDRFYVAIVRGKGMGQWRRVAAHDTTGLTVDSPWQVAPNATSTYAVMSFSNFQQTWIGNAVANGQIGLQFWNGAIDSALGNNSLKDTGGIMLRGSSEPSPADDACISQNIAWNVAIRNNAVVTTNARTPASISVAGVITQPIANQDAVGSLLLGIDVRNNTTVGSLFSGNTPQCQNDGYEVLAIREVAGSVDPLTDWGTVCWNNSVTNTRLALRTLNLAASAVDPALAVTATTD